jgi:hypothetical protein
MATLLRSDDSKVDLNQITFDDETNSFRLADAGGEFRYEFHYALQKDEVEHQYEVHLLFRKDVRNEEISQIYDAQINERIGWGFPVAALTTNEHSYAENEHFLRTAFGAYKELLRKVSFEEVKAKEEEQYLDKLLFLDPDTFIICFFRTFIDSKIQDFDIRNYFPSLYRFGISTKKTKVMSPFSEGYSPKIKLGKICAALEQEQFIREIFDGLIYESHPLVRFVVLYQVIELCLDRILLKELNQLIQGIKSKDIYVRDIRSKLEAFESEKKRINKLFNDYQPNRNDSIRAELLNHCKAFLETIGHSPVREAEFADTFYLVRNTIFHNFRSINRGIGFLDQINDLFSHLVADLVMRYDEH